MDDACGVAAPAARAEDAHCNRAGAALHVCRAQPLWHDAHMANALAKLFAALPDAITAATFLVAWVAPSVLGAEYIPWLMLVMLMEFLVVHSSGFYAFIVTADGMTRARRLLMLTGLSCLYLVFVFAFAFSFHSNWPIFAFAWLFGSRFIYLWTHPTQRSRESTRTFGLWVEGAVSYVALVVFTAVVPMPSLGMTPEVVASLHLTGSGVWIEQPQSVLAFGLFYFSAQSWAKYAIAAATPVRTATSNTITTVG